MARYAYVTLITRASYLAGVVILAHSLRKQGSPHPLIVCYTSTLSEEAYEALQLEAKDSQLILLAVAPLQPPAYSNDNLVTERFIDTWTKIRVLEPWQPDDLREFDRLCYLDADMMLRKSFDFVFDIQLPGWDWIGASQCCLCNSDKDPWAPWNWRKENCAHTISSTFSPPAPVPRSDEEAAHLTPGQKQAHAYFNSGMFIFQPSERLWNQIHQTFLSTSTDVFESYILPDQDFLNCFFRNRWLPLGWRTNALKTLRFWHSEMWNDDVVVNVHYIVDKPWAGQRPVWVAEKSNKALLSDPSTDLGSWTAAGFKGRDAVTHSWWWANWDVWRSERLSAGQHHVVEIVEQHMSGGALSLSSDMQAIGAQVQSFANNKTKSSH